MDFVVISASEISPVCRERCSQNYPGRFQHFYDSIEAQLLGGSVCASCSEKVVSQLLGPCKPKGDLRPNSSVAILFTGSPCDPFSTQRSKRFVSGNVKDHSQFDVNHGEGDTTLCPVWTWKRRSRTSLGLHSPVCGRRSRNSKNPGLQFPKTVMKSMRITTWSTLHKVIHFMDCEWP